MYFRKNKLLSPFVCFLALVSLSGCNKQPEQPQPGHERVESVPQTVTRTSSGMYEKIKEIEESKARILLQKYFGSEYAVINVIEGPAGTYIIESKNIDDSKKTFVALPDGAHLVEGTLYSPLMTQEEITNRHSKSAKINAETLTKKQAATALLKKRLREQMENPEVKGNEEALQKILMDAISQNVEEQTMIDLEGRSKLMDNKRKQKQANEDINEPELLLAQAKEIQEREQKKSFSSPESSPLPPKLPKFNTVANNDSLYADITESNWIADGEHENVMYVFYDFQCPACRAAHHVLDKFVLENKVEVRYIPVGALGQTSQRLAMRSLLYKDKENQLKAFKALAGTGQSMEFPKDKDKIDAANKEAFYNMSLLLKNKVAATPTFAYMSKAGPQIKTVSSAEELIDAVNSIVPTNQINQK